MQRYLSATLQHPQKMPSNELIESHNYLYDKNVNKLYLKNSIFEKDTVIQSKKIREHFDTYSSVSDDKRDYDLVVSTFKCDLEGRGKHFFKNQAIFNLKKPNVYK